MSEAPRKLCECGCGKPTPISKYTDNRTGAKRGQPTRFIRGHVANLPDSSVRRAANAENQRRRDAVAARRKRIAELYRDGKSFAEIVKATGASREIVAEDIRKARVAGVDLPYRNVPTKRYVTAEMADEIVRLWKRGVKMREIGEAFGWERVRAFAVIAALRSAGHDLPYRLDEGDTLDQAERRAVVASYKKRKRTALPADAAALEPRHQMVLRALQAAQRPVGLSQLFQFLRAAGENVSKRRLGSLLMSMSDQQLIMRVETPEPKWHERRYRWFVPLDAEQPAENLTLADAERETELAALIESQQDELKRGDWTDSEKGHWADKSLDAPLAGTDGFTILDTLGDEDEALADLMEEYA